MEERKLLEQIDQWNGDDEFSHCIEDIEAIPEKEHSYLLTFKLNCAYSNLAVLGYHSAHREVNENLLWYSIELLEYVRSQGEIDSYWNAYMGYANVMVYSFALTDYEYAKASWLWLLETWMHRSRFRTVNGIWKKKRP